LDNVELIKDPYFLVAMPQLKDPNFERSVILMLPMPGDGDIGLILNREMGILMESLQLEDKPIAESLKNLPLSFGGPVTPEHIIFLANGPEQPEQTVRIGKNTYLGCTLDFVEEKVKARDTTWRFRAFCGYSGWSPGQLEGELTTTAWMTAVFDDELVFTKDVESIWRRAVKILGFDPDQLSSDDDFTLQ
jgi:putative transcriptional regulator